MQKTSNIKLAWLMTAASNTQPVKAIAQHPSRVQRVRAGAAWGRARESEGWRMVAGSTMPVPLQAGTENQSGTVI
jgi:hypothetical protein